MPVYLYECALCGEFEVEMSISDPPLESCGCGEPVRKLLAPVQFCVPEHMRASTFSGSEGERRLKRQVRTNNEIAKGLANGTMDPPSDRDVFGEAQTRESKNQFNRIYEKAKNG